METTKEPAKTTTSKAGMINRETSLREKQEEDATRAKLRTHRMQEKAALYRGEEVGLRIYINKSERWPKVGLERTL